MGVDDMRINKRIIILFILIIIILTSVLYYIFNNRRNDYWHTVESFFEEKSSLYEKQEEIRDILEDPDSLSEDNGIYTIEDEKLSQVLGNIKSLLSEDAFNKILASRYLIDSNLMSGSYDKGKIDIISYDKITENDTSARYRIDYTERLYYKNKIKEEKSSTIEILLDFIEGRWIITNIYHKK